MPLGWGWREEKLYFTTVSVVEYILGLFTFGLGSGGGLGWVGGSIYLLTVEPYTVESLMKDHACEILLLKITELKPCCNYSFMLVTKGHPFERPLFLLLLSKRESTIE